VKKLMALLVAFAFTAGLAGAAAAQGTTTTPTTPAPAEKTTDKPAGDKTGAKKTPTKAASGTVKSASPDSLVVSGKEKGKDAEWTFGVDSNTKIKRGGKDITAADVKAGDAVNVRYADHEGKMVAHTVTVKGGTMAKKADTMKKDGDTKK
jgi:hypothetical protein